MSQYFKQCVSSAVIDACRKAGIAAPELTTDTVKIMHGFDKLGDYFAMIEVAEDEYWEIYYGNPFFMGVRVDKDTYTKFWQPLDPMVATAVFMDVIY